MPENKVPEEDGPRRPGRPAAKTTSLFGAANKSSSPSLKDVPEDTEPELEGTSFKDIPAVPVDAAVPNEDLAELRKELAQLRKEKEAREQAESTQAAKTGKFVIHFVNDGLFVLGKMTYRGQELEFDTESQTYKDTQDANGWSFLEMRRDAAAQEDFFGKEYFREGPWTGKSFADIKLDMLKQLVSKGEGGSITAEELTQLDTLDKKRRRVPDPLPPISAGAVGVRRTGY